MGNSFAKQTQSTQSVATLVRFDRTTRIVHWSTSILFLTLIATAACLYIPSFSALIGRRVVVKNIHVIAGLMLPFPIIVGVIGSWGKRLRRDVGRLNRIDAKDRRWIRTMGRDRESQPAKFNAGQKINASFLGGSILVMLASGSIMFWHDSFSLDIRNGSTFTHDWLSLLIFISVGVHIVKAYGTKAVSGMLHGRVSSEWAAKHHPRWDPSTD